MSNTNPFAAPKARVSDIDTAAGGSAVIAALPVSDAWKARFYLLERAGGVKLPRFKELKFGERMKVNFNILAFLFGPFYYMAKGMWRKGLSLFALTAVVIIAASVILELVGMGMLADALGYGAAALFAVRANVDYYKKMVLQDNGWW